MLYPDPFLSSLKRLLVTAGATLVLFVGTSGTRAQESSAKPTQDTLSKPAEKEATAAPAEDVTFAPTARLGKGLMLRYLTQYNMTMRFPTDKNGKTNFSATTSLTQAFRYKVRDMKPDGNAVVGAISEGGRLLNARSEIETLSKEPDNYGRSVTLDKFSHIVGFQDPERNSKGKTSVLDVLSNASNLLVPLQFLPLPEKPVRTGESWTARYALSDKNAEPAVAGEDNDVKATLTLLGTEKIGSVTTLKIKQVLTIPFVAYADATGKPTDAKDATGRVRMVLTFTQNVNALAEEGLMVQSLGELVGTMKFEGTLLRQVPSDTMLISGKMVIARLADTPPK